jgi:hypothetical protein
MESKLIRSYTMKKNFKWTLGLLILVPLFLYSCSTTSKAQKEDVGKNPQVLSEEGVTLDLRYLDQKALYSLHNNRNNPFLYYTSGTLTVIDLKITSDSPAQLVLKDMQLSSDKGVRMFVSKQTLSSFWNARLTKKYSSKSKGKSQYSNWTERIVLDTIEQYVYTDVVEISPGAESSGYVLFEIIRGAKSGKLTLPVYDGQGGLIHEFSYEFSF